MANRNALPTHFDQITHICCIGAQHASVMSMAVIAAAHPDVTVTIVDYDFDLLERWVSLDIDLVEPGFQELLDEVLCANLFFSDLVEESINEAQMIFFGVEIPTKRCGLEAKSKLDCTRHERALRSIMTASTTSKVIVEKSTMPIYVLSDTTTLLRQFAVFSNPDLYSPGQAIEDLRNPEKVIIVRKSDVGDPRVLQEMYAAIVQDPFRITVLPTSHVAVDLGNIAANADVAVRR